MAGLISDTLNLSSPTATPTDRAVLERLATGIAGIDGATLAAQIFAVGSPLLTLRPDEVVTSDCKEYAEAGVRFSVAQIEELGFGPFYEKHAELAAALDAFCAGQRLFFSALLVTDINTQNSLLLVSGSEEFPPADRLPGGGSGPVAARRRGVAQEATPTLFAPAVAGNAHRRAMASAAA